MCILRRVHGSAIKVNNAYDPQRSDNLLRMLFGHSAPHDQNLDDNTMLRKTLLIGKISTLNKYTSFYYVFRRLWYPNKYRSFSINNINDYMNIYVYSIINIYHIVNIFLFCNVIVAPYSLREI